MLAGAVTFVSRSLRAISSIITECTPVLGFTAFCSRPTGASVRAGTESMRTKLFGGEKWRPPFVLRLPFFDRRVPYC